MPTRSETNAPRPDSTSPEPIRVLLAGGSGFLGSHLKASLRAQGHQTRTLTRHKSAEDEIAWDPARGAVDLEELEGFDAAVNLAGQSLMSGRWTPSRKESIWKSRVDTTRFLVETFGRLRNPPRAFVSGSASGIYGDVDDGALDESADRGSGFLADLCAAWEAEAIKAGGTVERVALLRTGLALHPSGGALRQMLPAFRFGLGGPLGDGEQWFPWIALEDWVEAATWCLFRPDASGPVNLVAPEAVRQRAFARELGRVLSRPSFARVPKFALKAVFGEMAEEALLSGAKVAPAKLVSLGYRFRFPELGQALRHCLGQS